MKTQKKLLLINNLLAAPLLIPLVVTSCSAGNNKPQPEPDPNPNPNPNPEQPKPPVPNTNEHAFHYKELSKATSALDIIKKSKNFKEAITDLEKWLKDNNIDFAFNNPKRQIEEFNKLNQEVGIFNEYGQNQVEKMQYAIRSRDHNYNMQQKLLSNFTDTEATNAISKIQNIDDLIFNNQFGFLPSNLSQLLYYMSYYSIGSIFKIENVTSIKMNFNDEEGSAKILISSEDGKKYLFQYQSTDPNSTKALKRNHDFRQYIYDRSFFISYPRMAYTEQEKNLTNGDIKQKIKEQRLGGTGWVLDRIDNPNLPTGQYEFLVATNLHVLDVSYAFNKDRFLATGTHKYTSVDQQASTDAQKTYNDHWDGGFLNKGGIYSDNQSIDTQTQVTTDYPKVKLYEVINKPRHYQALNFINICKPNELDVDHVNKDETIEKKETAARTQLNNTNIVNDLVWYTPEFKTTGTYTENRDQILGPIFDLKPNYDPNNFSANNGYDTWNDKRVGTISNAGADFGITKIKLSKEDIKKILPSLYAVIDTDQERNWYIKAVNQASKTKTFETSANSTLFAGGFPNASWKSIKSNSGKIYTQSRYIEGEPTGNVQTYWTKYDEQKNQKYNEYRGLVNWYKNRFKSPSIEEKDQDQYMPHGMQIQKVLQQSTITLSHESKNTENDILTSGSSGSMIINSRFELIGSSYSYEIFQDDDNKNHYFNVGLLFKNYTTENQSFSIIDQIIEKLKKENTHTFSLNRK